MSSMVVLTGSSLRYHLGSGPMERAIEPRRRTKSNHVGGSPSRGTASGTAAQTGASFRRPGAGPVLEQGHFSQRRTGSPRAAVCPWLPLRRAQADPHRLGRMLNSALLDLVLLDSASFTCVGAEPQAQASEPGATLWTMSKVRPSVRRLFANVPVEWSNGWILHRPGGGPLSRVHHPGAGSTRQV